MSCRRLWNVIQALTRQIAYGTGRVLPYRGQWVAAYHMEYIIIARVAARVAGNMTESCIIDQERGCEMVAANGIRDLPCTGRILERIVQMTGVEVTAGLFPDDMGYATCIKGNGRSDRAIG